MEAPGQRRRAANHEEVRDVQEQPTVSVVIPTYNRLGLLSTSLRLLLEDPATTEVVVVVDGSRDGTMEWLEGYAKHEARVRPHLIENVGQAKARQYGLERASCELVLFLDDDIFLAPGGVTRHAQQHAGEDCLVLAGYTPNLPPEPRGAADFPAYLYAEEYERQTRRYEADPEEVLRSLYGGNVSIRRARALQVGMLSPGWLSCRVANVYHEDRDFGLRCREHGLYGRFDRALCGHHRFARDTAGFLHDSLRQGGGRWLLHHLHRDLLGPFPEDAFTVGLPAPLAGLVRNCRHRLPAAAVRHALVLGIRVSGAVHSFGVQTLLARVARRVLQVRGAWLVAQEHGGRTHQSVTGRTN